MFTMASIIQWFSMALPIWDLLTAPGISGAPASLLVSVSAPPKPSILSGTGIKEGPPWAPRQKTARANNRLIDVVKAYHT